MGRLSVRASLTRSRNTGFAIRTTPTACSVTRSLTTLAFVTAGWKPGRSRAFVAGGRPIYEQFLPVADRLVVTPAREKPDGDTSFADWDRNAFREVARDDRDGFSFVEYERIG